MRVQKWVLPRLLCPLLVLAVDAATAQAVYSVFEFETGLADAGPAGNGVATIPTISMDALCGVAALELDAGTFYRLADPPNNVPVGGEGWSLGMYIKPVTFGSRGLLRLGGADAPRTGVGLSVDGSGMLSIEDGDTNPMTFYALPLADWTELMLYYDGAMLHLYVDTFEVFSHSVALSMQPTSANGGLLLGDLTSNGDGSKQQGTFLIDDVRLALGWPGFPALSAPCTTPLPPTPAPPTPLPPTPAPPTPAPEPPPTPLPPSPEPPTPLPPSPSPTPLPPTSSPPTAAPPTPVPPTAAPPTPAPPTAAPATLPPQTPAPVATPVPVPVTPVPTPAPPQATPVPMLTPAPLDSPVPSSVPAPPVSLPATPVPVGTPVSPATPPPAPVPVVTPAPPATPAPPVPPAPSPTPVPPATPAPAPTPAPPPTPEPPPTPAAPTTPVPPPTPAPPATPAPSTPEPPLTPAPPAAPVPPPTPAPSASPVPPSTPGPPATASPATPGPSATPSAWPTSIPSSRSPPASIPVTAMPGATATPAVVGANGAGANASGNGPVAGSTDDAANATAAAEPVNATHPRSGLRMEDRESLELMQVVAAVAGVLGGGSTAGYGGRIALMRNWGCETGGVDPDVVRGNAGWWWADSPLLDFPLHPTGMSIGGAYQRNLVGACALNLLIVGACAAILACGATGVHYNKQVPFRTAWGTLRAPGILFIPYLFLLQGITFAAARLVFRGDNTNEMVLGVAMFLLAFATPAGIYWYVIRVAPDKAMVIPDPLLHPDQPLVHALKDAFDEDLDIVPYSGFKRDVYKFTFGEVLWVNRGEGYFVEKMGIVFERYRRQHLWFVVFELAVTVVLSLLTAWDGGSQSTCNMRSMFITTVFAVWLGLVTTIRPYSAMINNVVMIWLLGLMTLAGFCMTVAIWAHVDDLSLLYPTAYHALYGACVVLCLRAVWELVAVVADKITQRRSFPRGVARTLAEEKRLAEDDIAQREVERLRAEEAAREAARRDEEEAAALTRQMDRDLDAFHHSSHRLRSSFGGAGGIFHRNESSYHNGDDDDLYLVPMEEQLPPPEPLHNGGLYSYEPPLPVRPQRAKPRGQWVTLGRTGGYRNTAGIRAGRRGIGGRRGGANGTSHTRYPTHGDNADTISIGGVSLPPSSTPPLERRGGLGSHAFPALDDAESEKSFRSGAYNRPARMGGVAAFGVPDRACVGELGDIDMSGGIHSPALSDSGLQRTISVGSTRNGMSTFFSDRRMRHATAGGPRREVSKPIGDYTDPLHSTHHSMRRRQSLSSSFHRQSPMTPVQPGSDWPQEPGDSPRTDAQGGTFIESRKMGSGLIAAVMQQERSSSPSTPSDQPLARHSMRRQTPSPRPSMQNPLAAISAMQPASTRMARTASLDNGTRRPRTRAGTAVGDTARDRRQGTRYSPPPRGDRPVNVF